MEQRVISFEDAKAQYVMRFTVEHVPAWASQPSGKGYHAPQYRTDREWYDNTIFPGEGFLGADEDHCYSSGQTWPFGHWLEAKFESGELPLPAPVADDGDDVPFGDGTPVQLIEEAMNALRVARDRLRRAGASPRTVDRVRAALKSADGARRHAQLAPQREERQAASAAA